MRGQRDCISFTSELLSLKRRGQAAHRTPVWDVTPRKQRIRTQPPPPPRDGKTTRGQKYWSRKTTRIMDGPAGPWEEGTDGKQSTVRRTGTAGQVFSDDSYHGQPA